MTADAGATTALLIAAHGERQPGATNEGVARIVRAVRAGDVVSEVAVGFINGVPTVADGLAGLAARRVIVYPLFAANGYFTRDRLVQLIDEATGEAREIEMLAPLGLDPGLPELVAEMIERVARENGFAPADSSAVLLAHGSRRNPASREATELMARKVGERAICRDVAVAFLEEPPDLEEAMRSIEGPAIVVGMFSGDGLHGARDAPHLIAKLGRSDVVYAGVIGNAPGIADLISRSVHAALNRR
ncbi:MAG: sirohydrochlorin chelatase [Bradyrhizobium sp.]|uniref:sirohydrochlorin chelatase n=1 Tax=Bradyrhizobium sp. TaxID=376 RepID=UPI003D11E2EC